MTPQPGRHLHGVADHRDRDRPGREVLGDTGLLGALLQQVLAGAEARRVAAGNHVVEPAGEGRLGQGPAGHPHAGVGALAHQAVQVETPVHDAELGRHAAVDLEQRRRPQGLDHRIHLAAQPADRPVLGQHGQRLGHRLGPILRRPQVRLEMDQVLEHVEQRAEPPQLQAQLPAYPAGPGRTDAERHEALERVGVAGADVVEEGHARSMPEGRCAGQAVLRGPPAARTSGRQKKGGPFRHHPEEPRSSGATKGYA